MGPEELTAAKWKAIVSNDSKFDGRFFYAVRTTGIFCRPSCKSKPPKRGNICIFRHAEQALSAGFRPCKRCKPTGQRLPDEDWISVVTAYIDRYYMQPLNLETLADVSHGSMYHLHRTFKKLTGITPMAYIQQKRIEHAKELLKHSTASIAEVGRLAGLSNLSYFITLFKKVTGHTPASYRQLTKQNREESTNGESS
ncbi:bifunctional transcriptional activator/DNA repair enzyme AdaA [Paenibacillus puerhi]|uniref:bifunctional transcriptional activator/DNA repair enzyme AdaA n=1 Tax=Paenibacillus puerhi TaxID=2692622 RepID=UPI00135C49BF|nr:bifunctional transcriptional activator/DNA repair enzyme AdaA [Paenibacillus puerhi]